MKLLYLHQYFTTPSMPGGTRSYEMARRLVARGHEVHMITTDREGRITKAARWHETEEDGIHVHWTPIPYSNRMSYRRRIQAFLDFVFKAGRRATQVGGDVVFATSTPLTIALPAIRASKRLHVPMVFEVRDLWPEVPIALGALRNPLAKGAAHWLERLAYKKSKRIVALAPGMKEHIVSKGYPADQITVIPNGADIELFRVPETRGLELRSRHQWLGDRPLLVYAGTLGRVNGVEYLLELAAAVQDKSPEVRFAVIGSGGEEEKLKRRASELGVLDRNLFMLGCLPKTEIPDWLSAATVTCSLIIDKRENWQHAVTNKFFDSLAAGRPIVNNHPGWQTSIAFEENCGIELSRSIPDATEQLVDVLYDREWLGKASQSAERLARERFDRDLLANDLERVLLDAVGQRS